MKKAILLLTMSFLILSCKNKSSKKGSSNNSSQQSLNVEEQSKIGRTNYAVIWKWAISDTKLIADNSPFVLEEITALWKKDVIENAYYDAEAPRGKIGYLPNTFFFFLKTHSESEAMSILDNLTIVKEGFATYRIRPVGILWLDRKTNLN